MILPVEAPTFSEALRMSCEVYAILKSVIKKKYGQDATNVGDEGGFAPAIQANNEGLDLVVESIDKAGYTGKIKIAMDVAASGVWICGSEAFTGCCCCCSAWFHHNNSLSFLCLADVPLVLDVPVVASLAEFFTEDKRYDLNFKTTPNDGKAALSAAQLQALYESFVVKYPIVSIEDPFEQDDWLAWTAITAKLGNRVQIVGDDLLVTNPKRIAEARGKKAANALLLKVNQIGTVTESIQAALDAQAAGWGVMVSHRSGETEDATIADLAVGLCAGQIKTGAPCRSERLAKYNQLLRIEQELGASARYAGASFRKPL